MKIFKSIFLSFIFLILVLVVRL